jgi:hypothetical protein
MLRTRLISCALVALGLACAEGASGSGATPDFQPTGGIIVASGNGSRFNATHVQGPRAQFNQRPDGTWGGSVYGTGSTPIPIDASFQGGQFVGSNIRLNIQRENGETQVFGTIGERIVRFEVGPTQIRVFTGSTTVQGRSETYVKLTGPGEYGGPQSLTLEGEAQQAPPTPAFALAMVAAFI